jgi:hypothetical protein
MAKSTIAGSSNDPIERWRVLRLGTSSLTSESTLDKSGISGTIDLQSPAPVVESLFLRGQLLRPASSSVDLTDGSGQETGSSPSSLSVSLEDSARQREAIPGQVQVGDMDSLGHSEIMEMARDEYENGRYEEAERLISLAEVRGADSGAVVSARRYVREARSRSLAASPPPPGGAGDGPSEEDPSAGGLLVP